MFLQSLFVDIMNFYIGFINVKFHKLGVSAVAHQEPYHINVYFNEGCVWFWKETKGRKKMQRWKDEKAILVNLQVLTFETTRCSEPRL